MRFIKWFLIIFIFLLAAATLHYTLPQRDIVRVTSTEIIRTDFSGFTRLFYAQADSGNTESVNRDLRLINAAYADGGIMVYRNEDTGFGWPPYLKFDSANLQAEAADLVSSRAEPTWAIVRHYGWRNEFFSIYPNAVSIREIADPNVRLIPWFNIIFFIVFGLILLGIFRLLQRFKRRRIDPMMDSVEGTWDDVSGGAATFGDRVRGWFKRWGG